MPSQKAAGVKLCTEGNQASGRSRVEVSFEGPQQGSAVAQRTLCDAKAKGSFSEVGGWELLSGKMEMGLVVQVGNGPSAVSNGPWAPEIILVQGAFQVVIQ